MSARLWNWQLWAGFGLSLVTLASYVFFVNMTPAVFWPGLMLFAIAAKLLMSGWKRVRREPQTYRGKIAGQFLTTLSVLPSVCSASPRMKSARRSPLRRTRPKLVSGRPTFLWWMPTAKTSPWSNYWPVP